MPNCDFFAYGDDHRLLLDHIFKTMPCRIFELVSKFDTELAEFRSLADVEHRYQINDWCHGQHQTLHLQIYADGASGKVNFRRDGLEKCEDAAYRYSCHGWGLIQLYLESPRNGILRNSHTNHNSETRARNWATTYPEMDDPGAWNWTVVNSFSRKLNRFIRKSGVENRGARAVLPHASSFIV
ncbi:MAG: hypothetical protein AAF572_02290 [Cyanobacteria bacterium P01_B01_bin.77]